ncbi:MAG: hypothetical protein HY313_03355 [Acidobacteria bacterium]|nr:hypothetical protein [Acidobacteriota bacterium]
MRNGNRIAVVEDTEAAQQWLFAHGLRRFLRVRVETDREAIRSVLLASNGSREEETIALLACPGHPSSGKGAVLV